jgi:hypothetical protein
MIRIVIRASTTQPQKNFGQRNHSGSEINSEADALLRVTFGRKANPESTVNSKRAALHPFAKNRSSAVE